MFILSVSEALEMGFVELGDTQMATALQCHRELTCGSEKVFLIYER
jgi:hypothetical protein